LLALPLDLGAHAALLGFELRRQGPDVVEVLFKWSDLQQAGWGTQVVWDSKLAAEIIFETTTSADFSVDNVGLFSGTPPTDPP
jgi:hypothetical protein